jgi:hypothetical protein
MDESILSLYINHGAGDEVLTLADEILTPFDETLASGSDALIITVFALCGLVMSPIITAIYNYMDN